MSNTKRERDGSVDAAATVQGFLFDEEHMEAARANLLKSYGSRFHGHSCPNCKKMEEILRSTCEVTALYLWSASHTCHQCSWIAGAVSGLWAFKWPASTAKGREYLGTVTPGENAGFDVGAARRVVRAVWDDLPAPHRMTQLWPVLVSYTGRTVGGVRIVQVVKRRSVTVQIDGGETEVIPSTKLSDALGNEKKYQRPR